MTFYLSNVLEINFPQIAVEVQSFEKNSHHILGQSHSSEKCSKEQIWNFYSVANIDWVKEALTFPQLYEYVVRPPHDSRLPASFVL